MTCSRVRDRLPVAATEAQISAQVKAVRTYWNKIYNSPTSFGQVAKLCRAKDERLKAECGAQMLLAVGGGCASLALGRLPKGSIAVLADDLQRRFGTFTVLTATMLGRFADRP